MCEKVIMMRLNESLMFFNQCCNFVPFWKAFEAHKRVTCRPLKWKVVLLLLRHLMSHWRINKELRRDNQLWKTSNTKENQAIQKRSIKPVWKIRTLRQWSPMYNWKFSWHIGMMIECKIWSWCKWKSLVFICSR